MILEPNITADNSTTTYNAGHPELLSLQHQHTRAEESLNVLSASPTCDMRLHGVKSLPGAMHLVSEVSSGRQLPHASGDSGVGLKPMQAAAAESDDKKPYDRSCCCVADDMAGDEQKAEKYIMDIPYSVLLSIYQSLDGDKGWEALASETGYTFDKIKLLELEGARTQGSPSRSLLWELGSRNTTVRQLYGYFSTLSRFREMKILENYVNAPTKPTVVQNGLVGLRPPALSSMDSQKSNTFKESPSASSSLVGKKSNTGSVRSDNINFNQPQSSSHLKNSLFKCSEKDKQYSGKQMPMTPAPGASSSSSSSFSARNHQGPLFSLNPNPPTLRPAHPNTSRQFSSSPSCSHPSLSHPQTNHQASSTSSSFSNELPSVSSLPGLENSFEVQLVVNSTSCFSFSEIVQATNGFSESNKIGEGAFGAVYMGVLRQNKCAVKKMFQTSGKQTVVERSTQVKRELTSLVRFRHENIVTLYGYTLDGESLCLVYQYMPNGSLEDRLLCKNSTPPLVWAQRLNILVGACQGLNFLHTMGEQPLIHGDIKSANILLDKHMEAKIGDLGQAQHATARGSESYTERFTHITRSETTTTLYGTKAYQPRELQTGGQPSTKSDVFSMGVVILEVFSGEQAYDERREGEHFLGDYFHSLRAENGEAACLTKIDRRAGECPQQVALAILSLADECTKQLKRQRPASPQLLQKILSAEELYNQKTGIKTAHMDSMLGSEHSCHVSYTSSPNGSLGLTGAPPLSHHQPQLHPTAAAPSMHQAAAAPHSQQPAPPPRYHRSGPTQTNVDVNLNSNTDSCGEKHYATQAGQVSLRDTTNDSRKMATDTKVDTSTLTPATSRQNSQASGTASPGSQGTPSPVENPLEYFSDGQTLPAAFRLQQAYDMNEERKRISRLSQCHPTKVLSGADESAAEMEQLPQTDPEKLAQMKQFDRCSFPESGEEKELNSLQSDPKKLAALKHFDEHVYGHPMNREAGGACLNQDAEAQHGDLACDPRKLAALRQFDEGNVQEAGTLLTSNIVQRTQREEEQALTSDPRKLATLTEFDAKARLSQPEHHTESGLSQLAHPTASGSASLGCGQDGDSEDSSLVSKLDYIVVPSQREALEVYKSLAHHPNSHVSQHTEEECNTLTPDSHPEPSSTSVADSCPASSQGQEAGSADQALLQRQRNFFAQYNRELERMGEESYEGEEDFDEEGDEFGEEGEELYYGDQPEEEGKITNMDYGAASASVQYSKSAQEHAPAQVAGGHSHPVPTEQDETTLNYFRQRDQHYENIYKKSLPSSKG